MLLKNRKNNDTQTQFEKFKRDLLASGRKPEDILNELLSSGKISKSQLENAKRLTGLYGYLLKK